MQDNEERNNAERNGGIGVAQSFLCEDAASFTGKTDGGSWLVEIR